MAQDLGNKNNWDLLVMGIQTGGFKARLFGYFLLYIPITLIYLTLLYLSKILVMHNNPNMIFQIFAFALLFLIPSLPFILWEKSIRKFRRANGLSVYGNIREELEQREIDERVRKEHQAFVNNGIVKDGSVDKNDIGYWFGLFEKGAITKDEYEAKKRELL